MIDELNQLQETLREQLLGNMGEPYGSLLLAMVLGMRDLMSYDFYQVLVATGTIHITAVSGLHVSIVTTMVHKTLSRVLKRSHSLVLTLPFIWTYALLAGLAPSVVRASLMATFACLAGLLGREYRSAWVLTVSFVLMILVNPGYLENVGFWLSFSATGGIIWLSGDMKGGILSIEKQLLSRGLDTGVDGRRKEIGVFSRLKEAVKGDLATGLAAQLATLPIIMVMFGQVSLISPLVNLVVVWMVPYIMVAGMFKLILGSISSILSYVMGIICFIPLNLIVSMVNMFAKVPYSYYKFDLSAYGVSDGEKVLIVIVMYVPILIYIINKNRVRNRA